MRRRRGEPSLFEILRDPVQEEKNKRRWFGGSEGPSEEASTGIESGTPTESGETGSPRRRPALGTESSEMGSLELGSPETGSSATGSVRSQSRSEGRADSPGLGVVEESPRIGHLIAAEESRGPQLRVERLPELPPGERSLEDAEEASFWTWLNQPIDVRYATIILYSVGAVLALILAYQFGMNQRDPLEEKLMKQMQSAADSPSYAPKLNSLPKVPLRDVKSKTGGPPGAEPKASSKAKAAQPATTKSKPWGIVVSTSPDRDGADNLLLLLEDAERSFGVKANIVTSRNDRTKKTLYMVYFGPFAERAPADELLPRVQRLDTMKATDFSQAYVREIPSSAR